MNLHPSKAKVRGILLLECAAYMGALAIILALGGTLFFESLSAAQRSHRYADDITRTLHAGERWRNDVRASARHPALVDDVEGKRLVLKLDEREVTYAFEGRSVWRTDSKTGRRELALANVADSRFVQDHRDIAKAWRWEIQLAGGHLKSRINPLFSFSAVNAAGRVP